MKQVKLITREKNKRTLYKLVQILFSLYKIVLSLFSLHTLSYFEWILLNLSRFNKEVSFIFVLFYKYGKQAIIIKFKQLILIITVFILFIQVCILKLINLLKDKKYNYKYDINFFLTIQWVVLYFVFLKFFKQFLLFRILLKSFLIT